MYNKKSEIETIDNEFRNSISEACAIHLNKCENLKVEGVDGSKLTTNINATMTLAIAVSELMYLAQDIGVHWQSVLLSALASNGKLDLTSGNIDELKSKIETALKSSGVDFDISKLNIEIMNMSELSSKLEETKQEVLKDDSSDLDPAILAMLKNMKPIKA